ncbi:LysR family transcriptional regulator [Rhodovulum sp. DZ06]|uniref:LysR family transcriptional regulator n=1 Tax=Rhodovulum sp. DZ06 TaxID=3425126 RepID=UPI003D34610C
MSDVELKLGQLRAFVAVAETGGLAAAARRVSRTPSAVSMSLKQLEENLGGPLFEGERKGRLTPLGEHCLVVARRMVDEHVGGVEEMLRFADGGRGEIRVAAVPSAACGIVSVALEMHRRMAERDPGIGVRVELRDGDSETVANTVVSGAAEIGVAQAPAQGLGLSQEPLVVERYAVLFPPDRTDIPGGGAPIDFDALEGEAFVTSPLMEAVAPEQMRIRLRHARARAVSLLSVGAAVRAGMGVSVAPLIAAERILSDLPFAPLAAEAAPRRLFLLQREGETLSPAAQGFVARLREAAEKG